MKKAAIVLIILSAAVIAGAYWLQSRTPEPVIPVERADVTLRTTSSGDIAGFIDTHGAYAWLGVPYAEPPTGNQRWRAPQPAKTWNGVKETLAVGGMCPQFASLLSGAAQDVAAGTLAGSEDCLYLNVWSPPNAANLPVMLWVHGGGNTIGHGGSYSGARLATAQNVVVVTINYRLGVFGWFNHPGLHGNSQLDNSGNYGTLDIVSALQWTQDNIKEFGGNPGNVTLFGESAGAFDTLAMMASPLAKNHFHRAIVQSGGLEVESLARAQNFAAEGGHAFSAREIMSHLMVSDGTAPDLATAHNRQTDMSPQATREYLYSKSMEDIFAIFDGRGFGMIDLPANFGDGTVLPHLSTEDIFSNQDNYNAVPVILGTNRDEPSIFMARDPRWVSNFLGFLPRLEDEDAYRRAVKYGALAWKARGVDSLANYMRTSGHDDVYAYRFDWDEEGSIMGYDLSVALGAAHGLEIAFVFGDFDGGMNLGYLYEDSDSKEALADSMMSYWAQFAYTGDPSTGRRSDQPRWTAWGEGGNTYVVLDTPADKGIFMTNDEVSDSSIVTMLASAEDIGSQEERCRLYATSFRQEVDEVIYNTLGGEGCQAFKLEDLRGF